MLRITKIEDNGAPVTLKLEGKVSDQWAALLNEECRALLDRRNDLRLDFAGVTFMDADGVEVVKGLSRRRITIVNAPSIIRELLR